MAEPGPARGRVDLVPVGPVNEGLLAWLRDELAETLDRPVGVDDGIPRPDEAYSSRRAQYVGDGILQALRQVPAEGAERVLGLIDADCYAPGLNFIFGQASLPGREALVALPRLRESFYGRAESAGLFRERVLKECVHELGHTWGLRHCPDPACVMHFSNRLEDTDVKGVRYCPRCHPTLPGTKR